MRLGKRCCVSWHRVWAIEWLDEAGLLTVQVGPILIEYVHRTKH